MGQTPSSPSSQSQSQSQQDWAAAAAAANQQEQTTSNLNSNSKRNRSPSLESEQDELPTNTNNNMASAAASNSTPSDSRSTRKRKSNVGSSINVKQESDSSTNNLRRSTRNRNINNSSSESSTQSSTAATKNGKSTSSTSQKLRELKGKGKNILKKGGARNRNASEQPTVEEVQDEEMVQRDGRRGQDQSDDGEMQLDSKPKIRSSMKAKGKGKGKGKAKEVQQGPSGSSNQPQATTSASTSSLSSAEQSRSTTSGGSSSTPRSASSALSAALARLSGRTSSSGGNASSTAGNQPSSSSSGSNGIPSVLPAALGALGALALGLPMINLGGNPGEAPGPLQALLSDIMGPTSLTGLGGAAARTATGGAATGTTPGSGGGNAGGNGNRVGAGGSNGNGSNAAGGGANPRSGGTSIIVQGALLARTLPSTPRNRSDNGEDDEEEGHSQDEDEKEASAPDTSSRSARYNPRFQRGGAPEATEASSSPVPPRPEPEAEQQEGGGGGMPQAATIEDQASMLQRLLSVASAATALSLVTNDQQAAISERASQAAAASSSSGRGRSRDPASDVRNAVTEHLQSGGSGRPIASNNRTRANEDGPAIPTSNDTAAIANQVRGTLRNRLSGSSSIPAPTTPPSTSNNGQHSSPTSNSPFGNRWSSSRTQSYQGDGDGMHESSSSSSSQESNPIDQQSAQAAQATNMGRILQDTLRGGFGRRMNQGNNSNSTNHNRNANSTPQTQLESINETLNTARNGMMERGGSEGSFQNFMYDLVQDLGVAVRATSPNGEEEEEEDDDDSANDEVTRLRREGDLSSGRLSFYRLFRFEPQPRGNDSNSSPPLIPALIVGVRSMSTDGLLGGLFGGNPAAATAGNDPSAQPQSDNDEDEDEDGEESFRTTRTSRINQGGVVVTEGERRRVTNNGSGGRNPNGAHGNGNGNGNGAELPSSRFLLFICGGSYSESHPLLTSPANIASRDVLALIEILSIFNAMGMATAMGAPKPPTATEAELKAANFKLYEGKDIAQAALSGEIHESTAEKCLICWDEWKDDDKCRSLSCKHAFHQDCVFEWLQKSNNSCPCCRAPAVVKEGQAAPQAPVL